MIIYLKKGEFASLYTLNYVSRFEILCTFVSLASEELYFVTFLKISRLPRLFSFVKFEGTT